MKVLLEIKDEKAAFFLELLKNFSFVNTKAIDKTTVDKENFLKELQEAVEQVNQAKRGKIKLKSAEALLDEL